MKRSQNTELAKRINQAYLFWKEGIPATQIVERLSSMFGTSKVQAYRYLKKAKANKGPIAIPEDMVVFTVKLPPSLIKEVKRVAYTTERSISKVVSLALKELLARSNHGKREKTG